jgi:D-sedoheptulose 7-phosphate isomerase
VADELETRFRDGIVASIRAHEALLEDAERYLAVGRVLVDAYRGGGALFLFGNGGSAADAQHIAAEFLGRFRLERPAMAAHALTVNTSALTAIGNDYSFEQVFARQLAGLGRRGDVAVGISTSGNAGNVVAGIEQARKMGLVTVALTGRGGGRLRAAAEHWVGVPTEDTPRIQECHILLGHLWAEMVEAALNP